MTPRRADILTLVLLASIAAALLWRLDAVPALTSDEAWIGLYALRLRARGFYTPHEMNAYTGPLYGWIVSKVIAWRGTSIGSLRAFGAGTNVAAAALLIWDLRRRIDAETAAWGSAIVASSAYFLLKSRLAWDVYALQPLLLSLTLLILDGPATWRRTFLLGVVTLIGVQNHFIYLSVPASLVAMYGARCAWRDEAGAKDWLRASVATLCAAAVVFLVKPRLSDQSWANARSWAIPLFILLPFAAATAAARGGWESGLVNFMRRDGARLWLGRALTLGLTAFAVWHIAPLWAALSGPLIWKRVFSWSAPFEFAAPLMLYSAFLLGMLAWRATRVWHGHESTSAHERTLALWPAFYAGVFILFRNTSSLRYYSIIQFLCMAALGPALARLPRPDRRVSTPFAAIAFVIVQGIFWREVASPMDRAPLEFRIGWHGENSRDFLRKESLFGAFDASGACVIGHQERSFVSIPLDFHQEATPGRPCDPRLAFDADFCGDCARPPYFRWEISGARR